MSIPSPGTRVPRTLIWPMSDVSSRVWMSSLPLSHSPLYIPEPRGWPNRERSVTMVSACRYTFLLPFLRPGEKLNVAVPCSTPSASRLNESLRFSIPRTSGRWTSSPMKLPSMRRPPLRGRRNVTVHRGTW